MFHIRLSKSHICFQFLDALFFLKDFFSNMAAGVNPYLSIDPAAEGKSAPHEWMNEFIYC